MRFSRKKVLQLVVLAMTLLVIDQSNGEDTQNTSQFTIDIKGIQNAVDAYRIRFALASLKGVDTVSFIIPGSERFRACCRVSEEYNLHLRKLETVPMVIFTKGVPASEVLDFLQKKFKEFLFELRK
jgi:hypothetical protein